MGGMGQLGEAFKLAWYLIERANLQWVEDTGLDIGWELNQVGLSNSLDP